MEIRWSRNFEKGLRKLDLSVQKKVREKLKLFFENKMHPSLRYKKVQAFKHEKPPVFEISVDIAIRITLQEFDDHVYLRNIGGHNILP